MEIEKEEVEQAHQIALDTIDRSEKTIYQVAFISLALAVGLALFISRSIAKPLLKLQQAATKIGRGEFSTKIEITSQDEIGSLAHTFNKMANELQETTVSRNLLESANQSLQAKIIEKEEAEKKVTLERQNLYNILSHQFQEYIFFDNFFPCLSRLPKKIPAKIYLPKKHYRKFCHF